MPLLMLKDLPRYECLLKGATRFPDLDPSALEVYLHLLRTGDEVFRVTDAFLSANNISQGRFTVLMLLTQRDESCGNHRTPAELAEMAGVTRATMTGLIDTLERDGFVKREPDPNDRRMMLVNLTPIGEAFLARFLPEHFRRTAALMTKLTEAERKTLVQLLGKVLQGTLAVAAGSQMRTPQAATP
ncbi:MAG: MarR family transcriptional regulator [Opitutaceae bacterium]|nr:MarR family transcriptional regulator [Opitutaceae bacterium]